MIRYEMAYSMRMSGKKLKEIGNHLCVGVERARQLVYKGKRKAMRKQRNLEMEIENAQGTIEEIAHEFISNIRKIKRVNKLK